jgi:hypothetical protein
MTIFWSIILCKWDQIFFHHLFKNKIIYNFVIFVATKNEQQIFFHPSRWLLFLDPGSGMDQNQDPESGINIPDPQHCEKQNVNILVHVKVGK